MNKKIMKLLIIILIIIFVSSYLIADSGYYEYNLKQQSVITHEKIKEFENDIKNEKDINLIDYLNKDKLDYTNKFSNIIYNISNKSNTLTRKLLKKVFKKISLLIDE